VRVSLRISFYVLVFSWPCGESIIRAWAGQLAAGLADGFKRFNTEKTILATVQRPGQ
jgi:hypothetical protein